MSAFTRLRDGYVEPVRSAHAPHLASQSGVFIAPRKAVLKSDRGPATCPHVPTEAREAESISADSGELKLTL